LPQVAPGGGGLFRDRDDRDEAARLLIEREADKERALQQSEDEAEEAQRALDERERQALQEQDEDAERRKREESEDLQQERRHRRELKEAEHDAKLQELYRGSAAPKTPEKLPQHWLEYFSADEKAGYALIDAGKAAQIIAVALTYPAGSNDADWENWGTAWDALLSAERNSEAAWLKAGMSAPEPEGELFLHISSVVYGGMGGSQETIWDSPVEEIKALQVSISEVFSGAIKKGSPSSQDRVALRSKFLELGIEAERLGQISLRWNAMMQAAFTPETIAEVMQRVADMERYLIAIEKAAAAHTEYAHELSYCAHSSSSSVQYDECYDERVHRLSLKTNAAHSDARKAATLLDESDSSAIHVAARGEIEALSRAWDATVVALRAHNDAASTYNDALAAWEEEEEEERFLDTTRAWADAAVAVADATRAVTVKLRAAVEADTVEFMVAGATSSAAQNAQPAKAPQNADAADWQAEAIEAAKQIAAANCYDGSKLLIRPHETMRDFEARCGPRPAAAAPR